MKHQNYAISEAGLVTGTINGDSIDLREVYGFSVHGIWTKNSGTVAGTFKLQVSNNNSDWIDYDTFTAVIGDANGQAAFEVDGCFFAYLRVVTILTGGNIDLESVISVKG